MTYNQTYLICFKTLYFALSKQNRR